MILNLIKLKNSVGPHPLETGGPWRVAGHKVMVGRVDWLSLTVNVVGVGPAT
jgi:hypothetical protein